MTRLFYRIQSQPQQGEESSEILLCSNENSINLKRAETLKRHNIAEEQEVTVYIYTSIRKILASVDESL